MQRRAVAVAKAQRMKAMVKLPTPAPQRVAQVLRNIPVQYTRSLLLGGLEHHGFKGLLDLLYLPCDLTGRGGCNNVSSALLHFGTSIAAKKFADTFHNRYMMDLLPGFDLPGRILQVTAVSRTLKEEYRKAHWRFFTPPG